MIAADVIDLAAKTERFWSHVDREPADGCWLWIGSTDPEGYGRFQVQQRPKRRMLAHRVAYLISGQEIPDDKELDHLCRVRNCVNPAHLEPVAHVVNVRRGAVPNGSHCRKGHPYAGTPWQTYRKNGTQYRTRVCRTCQRVSQRRYALRKKEKAQ